MIKSLLIFLIISISPFKDSTETKTNKKKSKLYKKYILLSIDVEASKSYAKDSHIDHLIYGKFPGHPSAGILDMMDLADSAGVKLTFFLDFCEEGLYGIDPIVQISKDVLSRGHNLETHCHPSTLGKRFWNKKFASKPKENQSHYSKEISLVVFSKIEEIISQVKEKLPLNLREKFNPKSYRAGALRYNDKTLKQISEDGYKITSNYWNRGIKGHSHKGAHKLIDYQIKPFYWDDQNKEQLLEIPLHGHFNNPLILEYISLLDPNLQDELSTQNIINKATRHNDVFWEDMNHLDTPVINLIMHSWSFLCHRSSKVCNQKPNTTKYYTYGDPQIVQRKKEKFLEFLKNKPANFEFISFEEFYQKIESGEIKITKKHSIKKARI